MYKQATWMSNETERGRRVLSDSMKAVAKLREVALTKTMERGCWIASDIADQVCKVRKRLQVSEVMAYCDTMLKHFIIL